jgi:hypothetical protein
MAIRHPLINEIAKDTYLINEFGLVNIYVLAGSEHSLVIDAGMGYCDLKAIVESLTDKPYDVVITHAHPDHAGMIHQFDRVYLNEKEVPSLSWVAKIDFDLDEFVRNNRLHVGNWEVWEVTEDMINRGNKDTRYSRLQRATCLIWETARSLPTVAPGTHPATYISSTTIAASPSPATAVITIAVPGLPQVRLSVI